MCPFCVRHLLPRSATVLWTSRLEPQRQRCHAVEYRRAHGTQAPPVLDEVEGRPVLARAEGVGGAGNRLRGREGACAPGQAHRTAADLRAEALSGDRSSRTARSIVKSRRTWQPQSVPASSTRSGARPTRLRACLAERRSEEGATTAAAGTPASATSHRSSTKANTTTDTRSPTPNLSTEVGELHVGGWSIVATRRRCRRGRCRCTSPTRGRCSGSRGRSRQAWPGSSSRTAGPRNRLTVAGRTGPPPIQWLLYSTASLIAAGRVSGHGCLLSCLALVRRAAGVSVRILRSLAVCWSMACGPLPVSSRTDGS